MANETTLLRREDDRLMGQMLAELKSMNSQLQTVVSTISELRAGEIQLPQCRENDRRITEIEKKINQHSYNDLNRRLVVLENDRSEHKDSTKWTFRAAMGAIIIAIVNILKDRIIQ